MKHLTPYIVLLVLSLALTGCKKFLDAKPEQSLTTINSLTDLQSILDRSDNVNLSSTSAELVSNDDYYLSYPDYQALDIEQARNMYTWQPANLFYPYTNLANDWTNVYNNVYLANSVLDHIDNIEIAGTDRELARDIKGQALFLRAYNFYKAVIIWAPAFDTMTSPNDLGIPLRLNSNFNEASIRSTVSESYAQIISDLKKALALLPKTVVHPYRGSKTAVYALLGEINLAMRQYAQARLYADSCLQLNFKLLDYNKVNAAPTYPIPRFNDEVIYDAAASGSGAGPIARSRARIDSNLIKTYLANDLRTNLFFSVSADGSRLFRGSYEGSSSRFNGLATDMVVLTRAECAARAGETSAAMTDLNLLLKNRFKTGTFVTITAADPNDALEKILIERRKELIMRGCRWSDIKRLNKEGYKITIQRNLNGKIFSLPPNDLKYALAIPEDVISLSGMLPNPR